MDDVVVMETVGSEAEAEIVCSLLRTAGIQCTHQITNFGAGAADGLSVGGPREILVRREDLATALELVRER